MKRLNVTINYPESEGCKCDIATITVPSDEYGNVKYELSKRFDNLRDELMNEEDCDRFTLAYSVIYDVVEKYGGTCDIVESDLDLIANFD